MTQQAVARRCDLQSDKRQKRKRRIWMLCGLPVAVVVMTAAGIFGSGAWFTNTSVNAAVLTAGNLSHSKLFTPSSGGTVVGDLQLTIAQLKPNTVGSKTYLGKMELTNTGDVNSNFTMTLATPVSLVNGKGGASFNLKDVVKINLTSDAAGTIPLVTPFLVNAGASNIAINSIATPIAPAGKATVYIWADWPQTGTPGSNTTGDNAYQQSGCTVNITWTQTQA